MSGHQTRTGVLAWNSRILASGSRDRNILQHDMRVSNDCINKLVGHKSEVKILITETLNPIYLISLQGLLLLFHYINCNRIISFANEARITFLKFQFLRYAG